jgi:hypothetical protein
MNSISKSVGVIKTSQVPILLFVCWWIITWVQAKQDSPFTTEPLNNFTVKGCQIIARSTKPYTFCYAGSTMDWSWAHILYRHWSRERKNGSLQLKVVAEAIQMEASLVNILIPFSELTRNKTLTSEDSNISIGRVPHITWIWIYQ